MSSKKQRRTQASIQQSPASTTGTVSTRTPFQVRMDYLKQVEYQRLNEEGHRLLNYLRSMSGPKTDLMCRGMNEYLREAQIIDLAYDSTTKYRGKVIGMGNNESSQLLPKIIADGDDDAQKDVMLSNFSPTYISLLKVDIRAVSAGGLHSLALSTNGVPYSWGASDDGALGRIITETTGNNENVDLEGQPAPVTGFYTAFPNQQNCACEDGQIIHIAASETNSLFLSIQGNVYQCGAYISSDGKKFSVVSEKIVGGGTTTTKTVFGINQKPAHVYQLPNKAIAISAGAESSAAILQDHTLVTWGKFIWFKVTFTLFNDSSKSSE
jgi:hypothetical protein